MSESIFLPLSQILAYADNNDSLTRSKIEQNYIFGDLEKAFGLLIHVQTNITVTRDFQHQRQANIFISHCQMKLVNSFVYLGANINKANKLVHEINRRIQSAKKHLLALTI